MLEMTDNYEVSQSNLAGYLHKKSTTGDWQRRYFEINGSYLTYYKSQKMAKLLAALSIPQVGTIRMLESTEFGAEFRIDIKDRQYILRAASVSEAETWVSTLIKIRDHGASGNNSANPMNAQHHNSSSKSTSSTNQYEPTANVQKSVRNGCLSCLLRACGW